jgi:acyl carrier protein
LPLRLKKQLNSTGGSMADTYGEIKAIIVDLLGADESKITMEARFREDRYIDSHR